MIQGKSMAASFIFALVLARLPRKSAGNPGVFTRYRAKARRKQPRRPCPGVEELGDRILPAINATLPIITPPLVFQSNPSAAGNAIAIEQVNGSTYTLVAGYDTIDGNQDFALWRFNSDGSLDTTFGNGGLATTDFGPGTGSDTAQAQAIAIDPTTGDIILAGSAFNNTTFNLDFAVAVYAPDGTPVSTFGSNASSFGPAGTITTDFGTGGDAQINAVTVDPATDQIVVAGYAYDGTTYNNDFALARYNFDGSLDSTFGASSGSFGPAGTVTTEFGAGAQANALLIDAAGNYIVAGSAFNSTTYNNDFALGRYDSAGNLDASFGAASGSFGPAGTVTTDFGTGGDAEINAAAIDPNGGQIVVAGSAYNGTTYNNDFALARYNLDGSLDSTFGASSGSFGPTGTVTTEFGAGAQVNALLIDAAGNYVAAGSAFNSTTYNNDFALARYDATGTLDANFGTAGGSFGPAGTVTTDFGAGDAQMNGLVLAPNGDYLTAGIAFNGTTASENVALAGVNSTGNLDDTFASASGGFGPAGTFTWQPAGALPPPPPPTDGGGPVVSPGPVILDGGPAPGGNGTVGTVSDVNQGPIGPQPEVLLFNSLAAPGTEDLSATSPTPSPAESAASEASSSTFAASHEQGTLSTAEGPSATTSSQTQAIAVADVAPLPAGTHGADNPGVMTLGNACWNAGRHDCSAAQ